MGATDGDREGGAKGGLLGSRRHDARYLPRFMVPESPLACDASTVDPRGMSVTMQVDYSPSKQTTIISDTKRLRPSRRQDYIPGVYILPKACQ